MPNGFRRLEFSISWLFSTVSFNYPVFSEDLNWWEIFIPVTFQYPVNRAQRFSATIRLLGVADDDSYLEKLRILITEIGNVMGYVRLVRSVIIFLFHFFPGEPIVYLLKSPSKWLSDLISAFSELSAWAVKNHSIWPMGIGISDIVFLNMSFNSTEISSLTSKYWIVIEYKHQIFT